MTLGIGKTLYNILKEKNVSVTDLARNINIAPTTIYSIIDRDNMKIDISVLINICKSLDVDIEVFYRDYLEHESKKESIANEYLLTDSEKKMITQYRNLDVYGKQVIDSILKIEFDRCQSKK